MTRQPSANTPPNDLSSLERAWAWLVRNTGVVLLASGLVTLVLGCWGFVVQFSLEGMDGSVLDALYRTTQLLLARGGSEFNRPVWQLEVARFAGVVIFASSTLYLVSRFFNDQVRFFFFRTRVFFSPLLRRLDPLAGNRRGHVVVCGAGFLGSVIACHFRSEGRDVVLVEKDRDRPEVKSCREHGVLVLDQDATDPVTLHGAGVTNAAMVFAVTGDDARNTDIAATCATLTHRRHRHLPPLACNVHIDDANLSTALHQWELGLPNSDGIHIGFFNLYQAAGRSASACEFRHLLKATEGASTVPVVVIIGLGDFGQSLLVNLAMRWRKERGASSKTMRIIVVDREAATRVAALVARVPSLDSCCELVPKTMDIHAAEFTRGDYLEEGDAERLAGLYVCLPDEGEALSVAVTAHDLLCTRLACPSTGDTTPRILVRTVNDGGMTPVVEKMHESLGWNIQAFPILTRFCEAKQYGNDLTELLAEATHQDYLDRERDAELERATSAVDRCPVGKNPSAVEWPELPEDVKDTNRDQAESLIRNIAEYGYRVVPMRSWDEPFLKFDRSDPMIDALAIREHDRYVAMKTAQGYRYGPENDKENHINKTLIPWNDERLSQDEKEKDIQTILELPKRLADVYYRLERVPSPRSTADRQQDRESLTDR